MALMKPIKVFRIVSAPPSNAMPAMYEAAWSVGSAPFDDPFHVSCDLAMSTAKAGEVKEVKEVVGY